MDGSHYMRCASCGNGAAIHGSEGRHRNVECIDVELSLHRDLAEEQDRLGWNNFTERKIGEAFIRLVDLLMIDNTSCSRISKKI